VKPTIECTPRAAATSAASAIASASSTVLASGFSHSTCLPASSAAMAISACVSARGAHVDEVDVVAGDQALPVRLGGRQPSLPAARSTASASRPHSAVSAGDSGRSKNRPAEAQACEWAAPMKA
jgi:hypothetical protein